MSLVPTAQLQTSPARRLTGQARPTLATIVELLKPITWFAPMWAFGCGVVSSRVPARDLFTSGRWALVLAGVALSGPLVCGTSQVVNDWFDRHVDAINDPARGNRPGPRCRYWSRPPWDAGRWGRR